MYEGPSKPKDIDEFMLELTNEMVHLISNGLDDVCIRAGNYIMDTPARSLILDIKNSPGLYSCHKCWIRGVFLKQFQTISYEGVGHRLRTHAEFVAKEQYEVDGDKKENHHRSGFKVAIENIPSINIIKQTPIEYMHSTCAGLMKRLLEIWIKMCPSFLNDVDALIEKMGRCWPLEFQRKIRSLKFLKHFKASEYRFWLLYVAPAVMKHFLSPEQFNHFCLVHHAVRLLFLTPVPEEENLNLAQQCINQFLTEWPSVYGKESALTYVIHATEHLPNDCRINKSTPDGFSAFPFESYLRRVQRNYHTGGKQLEQVTKTFLRFIKNFTVY